MNNAIAVAYTRIKLALVAGLAPVPGIALEPKTVDELVAKSLAPTDTEKEEFASARPPDPDLVAALHPTPPPVMRRVTGQVGAPRPNRPQKASPKPQRKIEKNPKKIPSVTPIRIWRFFVVLLLTYLT